MKIVAQNKKATFDYEILEKLEAGIVLTGNEVKSLREGKVSLVGSFATIHDGQLFLLNCNITPYTKAFQAKKDDATKSRKLLVTKRELNRLIGDISRKGITIVALKIYFNDRNFAKVELGLAKHKKSSDKKESLRERDINRETSRELRGKYRY